MPQPYQSQLFKAKLAKLITSDSAENLGFGNWLVKRDFRRAPDGEARGEGYDYFWPNVSGSFATDPGTQPFPNTPTTTEPITLVCLARRPNGKTAVIVGTKTKLWKFISFDNGYYVDLDYWVAGYTNDNPGEWALIGSGFSASGHRWEAVNINGYTIFNNGVDLPMTYRIEEDSVIPIYELREQGVASVGTISELSGILLAGDVSEIKDAFIEDLFNPIGDISSGDVLGYQSGFTVTSEPGIFAVTTGGPFTAAMVGRTLVWRGHAVTKITGFTNSKQVTVNTSNTINGQTFVLRNKASQVGAVFSGLIVASMTPPSAVMTATSAIFAAPMVGSTVRFSNGFSSVIDVFTDTTHVTLHNVPSDDIVGLPFWISGATAYRLIADADTFTAGLVGKQIVFDDGQWRRITAYTDPKTVTVDVDSPMASQFFKIENPDTYAPFTNADKVNRIQYRVIWGIPNEPRRWGAITLGSMTAGSNLLLLNHPVRSFEVGQEILVVGAGEAGGNLTATILSSYYLGQAILLSEIALTTVTSGAVTRSDAFGSIVGSADLQDDSSGILRMMGLQNTLVIYKDTAMFLATYTGLVDAPFTFTKVQIPDGMTLFYRWTLVNVGGQAHVYAGANSFYKFDLTSRVPQVIVELEQVANIFFDQATLANMESIFAADNFLSNDVWFQFPSATDDKGIRLDYKFNSVSTTSIAFTAACTCKKPIVGLSTGVTEDWFIGGDAHGTVLLYGKSDLAQTAWGGAKEMFYRRSTAPYNVAKSGYDSTLLSGLESGEENIPARKALGQDVGGGENDEKDLRSFVLYLASMSPNCSVNLTLFGTRNPSEDMELLAAYTLTAPEMKNLFPVFFRRNYFQDQLVISGMDNPCHVSARSLEMSVVRSDSFTRRP